jgi:DUF1680 family protein
MFLKLMGAMPGYIYATGRDAVYVNLFVSGRATLEQSGVPMTIRQSTRNPWEGKVRITVEPQRPLPFAVMVRIPGWCSGETLRVNGKRVPTDSRVRGYVRIERNWQKGDVIDLDLPMPVRRVYANPLVQADVGRVAIMRGPVVYCIESADNSAAAVQALHLSSAAPFATEFSEQLLNGVVTVKASAVAKADPARGLYFSPPQRAQTRAATLTAIPYYANANRGPVDMAVWLPVEA